MKIWSHVPQWRKHVVSCHHKEWFQWSRHENYVSTRDKRIMISRRNEWIRLCRDNTIPTTPFSTTKWLEMTTSMACWNFQVLYKGQLQMLKVAHFITNNYCCVTKIFWIFVNFTKHRKEQTPRHKCSFIHYSFYES